MRKEIHAVKKYVALCLMVFVLLASSFAEELVVPVFEWERDLYTHWQLDENSHPVNAGEHTLDDAMFCTVCGSEIWDYGDGSGSGSVNNYDEQGNLVHYTDFAEGVIENDSRHILTYDENGVLILDLEFIGGVFFGEYTYAADENGNAVPVKTTVWYDDGTSAENEYDQYGNCVRSASYEADGSLVSETLMEYAMNEYGWYYECKTLARFTSGATFYSEYNQYGDEIRSINTNDDGTVWLDRVYEYKYAGSTKVWSGSYAAGMLVAETFYDADGCNAKDVEYNEDGSCIVYTYDEDGNTIETVYDAAGNPVE